MPRRYTVYWWFKIQGKCTGKKGLKSFLSGRERNNKRLRKMTQITEYLGTETQQCDVFKCTVILKFKSTKHLLKGNQ